MCSSSGDFSQDGHLGTPHTNKTFHTSVLPTPVKVDILTKLLTDYDNKDSLIHGFTFGFKIPSTIQFDPPKNGYTNHKSTDVHHDTVQAKLDKELALGRIAGPFESPPFQNMICSPLGIVPKKSPGEYRLIHDLSFPPNNSVNSHIDSIHSSVQYEVLDNCVEIIQQIGGGCLISKADLKDAFRIIPVEPASYRLLGFQWLGQYFYDRCLPMGCATSCQTFESLSQALQWVLIHKLGVLYTSHILDDFIFFGHPSTNECRIFLNTFLSLAKQVGLPIKESKTVHPSTVVVLHGIQVDTVKMQLSLPSDKVEAARVAVSALCTKKKVQLNTLQSVIGTLNFACRVVVPGRAFLRRLQDLTKGVNHPLHFIRLNSEARKDLAAWKVFLESFNGRFICLPNRWTSSNSIRLFSDASGAGFAAICGSNWLQGQFPSSWTHVNIAIKELLPIVLSIRMWGDKLSNSRILFMTDNESVVHIVNSQTSKDSTLMQLVRQLVISTMSHNIHFRAKHLPGKHNVIADLLSRFQETKAFTLAPWLKKVPETIPEEWFPW